MDLPRVSVIIPVFNGQEHLGEAIQSVLAQTYPHFELIVVDDVSKDNSLEVIRQFDDGRLKCIRQEQNLGAAYARKTGLSASSGEIIAFLDQDDLYHPDKLASHVAFLEKNPDVSFTYNSYFNLNHSSTTIRDISRPPQDISLPDLVLGFPLPPSVWVIRREWALREEVYGEHALKSTGFQGREIVVCGRLYMAGCRFAMVDQVLNYRRHHAGRVFGNLAAKCDAERTCQEIVFADPRCPTNVLAQRNIAAANIYLLWTYVAFAQEETELGWNFVRSAVRSHPGLLNGIPCELTRFLLIYAIDDENLNHETHLRRIFDQFPPELARVTDQVQWAAAQGYLIKGVRDVMWERMEDGDRRFDMAMRLHAELDEFSLQMITSQLLAYDTAFGSEPTEKVVRKLTPYLRRFDSRNRVRSLKGSYSLSRAFERYRGGEYQEVPGNVLQALVADPKYLTDRGVLSILLRSTVSMWAKS